MKIFKPIGSKERLVEMFQQVNKVKLNEGFGQPGLDPASVLSAAFNELKTGALTVKHSNTQAEENQSYVELLCNDKQGNNISFVFKADVQEGDQDGVFDVTNVMLEEFSFDSAQDEESVELSGDTLKRFNMQHANELLDVVNQYINVEGEDIENNDELAEAIKLIDAIKQQSYPFGGSPKDMQTGQNYADTKPTNPAVRVKSPELDNFIQEDLNSILHYSQGARDAGILFPKAKDMGISNQYILRHGLWKDIGVELLDIETIGDTYKLTLRFEGKKFAATIKKNYGNAAKVIAGIKKKLDKQSGLGESDKPAMKLIMQAPGGKTAGGVKQMNKPIVGGVASVSEDILGEPVPEEGDTDTVTAEPKTGKKKDDGVDLTKTLMDFDDDGNFVDKLNDKNFADFQDYQEPEDEPEAGEETGEPLSPEEEKLQMQAYDNLIARNSRRNPNYGPTMAEIEAEINRMTGKQVEKKRTFPKEAEPYLEESLGVNIADIIQKHQSTMHPENKETLINGVREMVDAQLGVKKFQIPKAEYFKLIKDAVNAVYTMGLTKFNEGTLNEEEQKSDYPDPIGKKFKPKKHYPKKKQKHDTTVKISEGIGTTLANMGIPMDKNAEKQAKQDIYNDSDLKQQKANYPQPDDYETNVADDLAVAESTDRDKYEDVVFLQGDEAYEPLERLDREGPDAALEYLKQWHYPGEHQGSQELKHGTEDKIYKKDGYIMSWNPRLDYIGLQYDLSQMNETEEMSSEEPQNGEIEQLAQDKEESGEVLQGGKADGKSPLEFDPEQVLMGLEVEKEHTDDPLVAIEIVMDHLTEDPEYYTQKDTPEASAQAGASADAAGEDSDKETTDALLGYKPMNVGDYMNEDLFKTLGDAMRPITSEKYKVGQKFEFVDDHGYPKIAGVIEQLLDDNTFVFKSFEGKYYSSLMFTNMGYKFEPYEDKTNEEDSYGVNQMNIMNSPVPMEEDKEADLKKNNPADWHQIQVAKKTMKMPGAMAGVMGGMSKEEAQEILKKRGIKY